MNDSYIYITYNYRCKKLGVQLVRHREWSLSLYFPTEVCINQLLT